MRCAAGERPLNPSRNQNTRHLLRALQAARDEARELRAERDFLKRLLDASVARNVEALGSTHRLIGRYLKTGRKQAAQKKQSAPKNGPNQPRKVWE